MDVNETNRLKLGFNQELNLFVFGDATSNPEIEYGGTSWSINCEIPDETMEVYEENPQIVDIPLENSVTDANYCLEIEESVTNTIAEQISCCKTERREDWKVLDQFIIEEEEETIEEEPIKRTRGRPKGSKKTSRSSTISKNSHVENDYDDGTPMAEPTCNFCDTIYSSMAELFRHFLSQHVTLTGYECGHCTAFVENVENFIRHLQRHNFSAKTRFGVTFICPLCKRDDATLTDDEITFTSTKEFYVHLKTAHELFKTATANGCRLCDEVIFGQQNFIDHVMDAHYDQRHSCPLCEQAIWSNSEIKEHLSLHYQNVWKDERDLCPLCELNFSVYDLSTHVITKHTEVRLIEKPLYHRCLICSNGFGTLNKLAQHVCPQLRVDTTECVVCRAKFPSKKRLTFHMQTHLNVDFTFECDVCWRSFGKDEDVFYNHVRFTHEVGTDLTCETCGATFSNKVGLLIHQQYHIGRRRFACKVCGKRFLNDSTLKEHKVGHEKVKPYMCHICGTSLSRPSRLRIHLRAHSVQSCRNSQICYSCTVCGFVAPVSTDFPARHNCLPDDGRTCANYKRIVLNKVLICEFCCNYFENRHSLYKHVELVHSDDKDDGLRYSCNKCDARFIAFSRLSTHRLSHGINAETGILSSDKKSRRTEFIIPQLFGCKLCDRVYNQYTAFNAHRKYAKHKSTRNKNKSDATSTKTPIKKRTRRDKFNDSDDDDDNNNNNNKNKNNNNNNNNNNSDKPDPVTDDENEANDDGGNLALKVYFSRYLKSGDTEYFNRKYICNYCDKRYRLESTYKKHLLLRHPKQQSDEIDRKEPNHGRPVASSGDQCFNALASTEQSGLNFRNNFSSLGCSADYDEMNPSSQICEFCELHFNDKYDYDVHKINHHSEITGSTDDTFKGGLPSLVF